ncbi:MAG: MgtC/SapB family protein [Phycisphaeraceae bacterium]|nr:MgtC/SapB family protein [Phycisphaeraceae bacterium]
MDHLTGTEMALRVGAALVCGALIGVERERKQRPAGFRTMILISLGSCGFMLIAHEAMSRLAPPALAALPVGIAAPGQAELSRTLQGLISGIGFIGAGAILQSKRAVRGITTAAAVWVVAALGAACGLGLFKLALILSTAALFTLIVLDVVENRLFPDPDDGHGWEQGNGSKGKKNADATVDSSGVVEALRSSDDRDNDRQTTADSRARPPSRSA